MKRSFYRRSPPAGSLPVMVGPVSSIHEFRLKILDLALVSCLILGAPILLASLSQNIQNRQIWLAGFSLATYVILVSLKIFWKVYYYLRTTIFLVVIFAASGITLVVDGLFGYGKIILLLVPLLSIVFWGYRSGLVALLAAWVLLIGVGIFELSGRLPIVHESSFQSDSDLFLLILLFVLVSVILFGLLVMLISGFGSALDSKKKISLALEEEQNQQERKVQLRGKEFENRLEDTQVLLKIIHQIQNMTDEVEIINLVVNQLKNDLDLYFSGIYMQDDQRSPIVLRAGTGIEGQQMVDEGFVCTHESEPMVVWSLQNQHPCLTSDTGPGAVTFTNPYLPKTRSEFIIPLLSGLIVDLKRDGNSEFAKRTSLGALSLYSEFSLAFENYDVTLYQDLGVYVGTALVKTRRLKQAQAKIKELEEVSLPEGARLRPDHEQKKLDLVTKVYQATDLEAILRLTVNHVGRYLNASVATIQLESPDLEFSYHCEPSTEAALELVEKKGSDSGRPKIEIPISIKGGSQGQLILYREADQASWTENDLVFASEIFDLIVPAIEKAFLIKVMSARYTHLQEIQTLFFKLAGKLDAQEILGETMRGLSNIYGTQKAYMQLVNEQEFSNEDVKTTEVQEDA